MLCALCILTITAGAQIFNVKSAPYNAAGNGITDDIAAIAKAIDAAHAWSKANNNAQATVYFPSTGNESYLVKDIKDNNPSDRLRNYVFRTYSNITFIGDTAGGKSTIKFADHLFDNVDRTAADSINGTGLFRNTNLFYGNRGDSNIIFRNLTIDFNGMNNLLPPFQNPEGYDNTGKLKTIFGIIMENGSHNLVVDSMVFKNNPGLNDVVVNAPGKDLVIKNSLFVNGGWCVGSPTIINKNSNDFSFIYSEWDNSTFTNNNIIEDFPEISLLGGHPSTATISYAGGIEIHGSNSVMTENFIYGCKPAVYITSAYGGSTHYLDNIPLKNIKVADNIMVDCHNGISFWVKNKMENVEIKNNHIQVMFLKNSPALAYHPFHYVYGIGYLGGNLPCKQDYEFKICKGCNNSNLNTINDLKIEGNTIKFNHSTNGSVFPDDVVITGIVLHSVHNSSIVNNSISGMNWSGISLLGSPWGTKNLAIKNNSIGDFIYSKNRNVAGYMVVTDYYLPNNDCSQNRQPTYKNISIEGNTFSANSVVAEQSLSKGFGVSNYSVSAFRALFFDLPQWYAYNKTSSGFSFKNGTFKLLGNTFNNKEFKADTNIIYATSPCTPGQCK